MFLSILFAGVSFSVTSETGHGKANWDLLQAKYAAEAGAKRALSVFKDGKTGTAQWNWIQSTTSPAWQNLFQDSMIRYTVLIRQNNQNGAIVTNPGIKPAAGAYYVEATGQVGNMSQKYALTVTIEVDPSLPMGIQYVFESVQKAVQQVKSKNWRREGGKQYNADSWNGLAELILQEGSATLVAAANLKYDGSGDKKAWGSNWHYGRPDSASYIFGTEPATYTLQYGHPQDNVNMTKDEDYANFNNSGDYDDDPANNWNRYKDLNKDLWNGTPSVYSGGSTSLTSINNNSNMSSYFPPWVLLTTNASFSPANIDNIINDSGTTKTQKQLALKAILGTTVVYRNDSGTGAPTGNPVQIYKINVDKTGAITRSTTNLVNFPN